MRTLVSVLMIGAVAMLAAGCRQETTVEGEGARELTLVKPAGVTIQRGGTATVTVRVERKGFRDAVNVSIDNLPDGVSVVNDDLKIASDSREFVLRADDDAALVSGQAATVTAKGPGEMAATTTFDVTVKAKG